MNSLEIVVALNALLNLAADAKINFNRLQQLRDQAEREGRQITADELKLLARDSQAAIDRLPE